MNQPVVEADRIQSVDVLRGFALLGILPMNIQSFAMIGAAYMNPTAYGDLTGANYWVWVLSHVIIDTKMVSIFSMLFGAGIVMMWQRTDARGEGATRLHYRRMGWLILFGLLHAHALWLGDILYSYGVCGMIAYLFRRQTPRALFILALAFGLIGSAVMLGAGLSMPYWPADAVEGMRAEAWLPGAARVQQELDVYRGSWVEQAGMRSVGALLFETVLLLLFVVWKVLSLFFLGMALYKLGAFNATWGRRAYRTLFIGGLAIGLPVIVFGVARNFAHQWDVRYSFFLGSQFNYWGSYAVALAWIAMVMRWCQSPRLAQLRSSLGAVGRTAFSNYILQTLICTTIFYGHGFGYFGSVERAGQIAIVFAIWVLQLAIAPLWLARFQFGPLEWVWRSLTYGAAQPFRREPALAVQSS